MEPFTFDLWMFLGTHSKKGRYTIDYRIELIFRIFNRIFQATQKILEQFFNHLVSQGHRKTFTKAEPMRDPIATPSL